MGHKIPSHLINQLTIGPSSDKISRVAILQNYIQELLTDHHTFLQGSYKNDTAVYNINDVDIVAIRKITYSGVHSPNASITHGRIDWQQIFSEIEEKLINQNRYKWEVKRDKKCIKISGAFNADVVPAVQVDIDHLSDPICIYSFNTGQELLSHPRLHYENGVDKHNLTDKNYKPMVRMFKNWILNHFNSKKVISSHQIESLVYQTENRFFYNDYAVSFSLIGNDIFKRLNQRNLLPYKLYSVCGQEDISANWKIDDRQEFNNKLKESLTMATAAIREQNPSLSEAYWKRAFNI